MTQESSWRGVVVPLAMIGLFVVGCAGGVSDLEPAVGTPADFVSSDQPRAEAAGSDTISQLRFKRRGKHKNWSDAGTAAAVDAGTAFDSGTADAGGPIDPIADAGAGTTPDAGAPPDAGPAADAGPTPDAGTPVDAGTAADAGATPDAGQTPDAGSGADAGTPIPPGDAGVADFQFVVDSAAAVHPISRYIYGSNFHFSPWSAQPNLTLNRLGGNRWTAYNWENNASNAGSDYNYQNDSLLGSSNTPGETVRQEVAAAQAAGGAMLVTVPMAGWVAADKLGTSVLGQPLTSRFRQSLATKGAALVYPPNSGDGYVYQDEFVSFVEGQFPNAHNDPAREIFYSLDNEPDLWAETHSEIHPNPVTYAELLSKGVEHAKAVKSVAPKAKVFGPVNYGYYGFTTLQGAPDANGRDFLDFYLDGMKSAGATAGKRLLDVLDLHWYPEAKGGGVRVDGEDSSATVAAARIQAPRSLWDPGYVETSWIANSIGAIRLLPRLQAKIASKYPGTTLAFTEYYYGGGSHISGGIAQADVLGVFGREGVFAATLWPMTSNIPYIKSGFAMFRSYDGSGSTFGDTSIRATTNDVANSSVYASIDSSGAKRLVLVVINKATSAKTAAVTVSHPAAFNRAEVYQLTSSSTSPIRGADLTLTQANAFRYTLPAMSVTTLVLRAP